MRTALRIESPSPESCFLEKVFLQFGEVDVLDPWDVRSHTSVYDLAVGVGPVLSVPLAKRKMLFVLGPTRLHQDLDWDDVIVTSPKAQRNAESRFKSYSRLELHPMPLLDMEAGKRRIRDRVQVSLCAFPVLIGAANVQMGIWSNGEMPFDSMEFNSLCRHGAYGYYCGLDDGYDIQVRKHLAFGSPVVCDCDPEVLGDLASSCVQSVKELPSEQRVVPDSVVIFEYEKEIKSIIRSI